MTNPDDTDFYLRREEQERLLAEQASDPGIAAIHRELAAHYAKRGRAAQSATVRAPDRSTPIGA